MQEWISHVPLTRETASDPATRRSGTIASTQMTRGGVAALIAIVVWALLGVASSAATYDEMRSAAVMRCQAIDPAAYQTGLLFNPDGYR